MKAFRLLFLLFPAATLACTELDPVAFVPPPQVPLTGALASNEQLRLCERIGDFPGAEDVAVDDMGRIYASHEAGKIVRISKDGSAIEDFAVTGGRPLGLDLDIGGNLWVADAFAGLLQIGPDGKIERKITDAGGSKLLFADDVEVTSDGKVYFSDASSRWDFNHYVYDAIEGRPTGRLIEYLPATGSSRVLLDGLAFANGVALSKDEDFVLVNETYAYRISRYWLSGPKAGQKDIFAASLPGFPDGITQDEDGNFWVAIYMLRNPAADFIAPYPRLKWLIGQLPQGAFKIVKPYGLVLKLDPSGAILESLHDPEGKRTGNLTSAEPYGESLYLGSLHGKGICRYPQAVKL